MFYAAQEEMKEAQMLEQFSTSEYTRRKTGGPANEVSVLHGQRWGEGGSRALLSSPSAGTTPSLSYSVSVNLYVLALLLQSL